MAIKSAAELLQDISTYITNKIGKIKRAEHGAVVRDIVESFNDISTKQASAIAENTTAKHSHSNSNVLEALTATDNKLSYAGDEIALQVSIPIITAQNGITKIDDNFELGGKLEKNISFTAAFSGYQYKYGLSFGTSDSELGKVMVNSQSFNVITTGADSVSLVSRNANNGINIGVTDGSPYGSTIVHGISIANYNIIELKSGNGGALRYNYDGKNAIDIGPSSTNIYSTSTYSTGKFSMTEQTVDLFANAEMGISINPGVLELKTGANTDILLVPGSNVARVRADADVYSEMNPGGKFSRFKDNTILQTNDLTTFNQDIEVDGNLVVTGANIFKIGTAPVSASAEGVRGSVIYTQDYIYVCTDTDVWKRTAITTW